jgi:hypothetical protein
MMNQVFYHCAATSGIDGFSFHNYFFTSGKTFCQIIVSNPQVKQPFTFNQFFSMIKSSEYLSEFADENGVGVRGKGERERE